jgi:pilus assembly protein CpaE
MAHLLVQIASPDGEFKQEIARLLRAGALPVSITEHGYGGDDTEPDVMIADIRGEASIAMPMLERLRASAPGAGLFAVARNADPDAILHAMRAGANEFLTWPPVEEAFHTAVQRTAARRETSQNGRSAATTVVFFGAKGGSGTTTIAVNCAADIARLSKKPTVIVDIKAGLGEVGLFLGVRPKYTIVDAFDNINRLDREFLSELVDKHKSGLEILAGSDHFERPSAADAPAIEEVFRLLTKAYDYIVVDAGSQLSACALAALYTADRGFLVGNPDVPSVRNAQRLLDRLRQVGRCAERVEFILNRAAEPFPIPLKQIESVVGRPVYHTFPSNYKVVSEAMNTGVPLASTRASEIAGQFDLFSRRVLDPSTAGASHQGVRPKSGLGRVASLW